LRKVSDNNGDESAEVMVLQKGWLKNNLSQSAGGATGRGCDLVEKLTVKGKDPKRRSLVGPVPNYTLLPFSRLSAFTTTTTMLSRLSVAVNNGYL
jgi:hypothetical protein